MGNNVNFTVGLLDLKDTCETILCNIGLNLETLVSSPMLTKKLLLDYYWILTTDAFHSYASLNHLAHEHKRWGSLSLILLQFPNRYYRGLLLRLRWNILPTKDILLRRKQILQDEVDWRFCQSKPELMKHFVLECDFLKHLRNTLLATLSDYHSGCSIDMVWKRCLNIQNIHEGLALSGLIKGINIV